MQKMFARNSDILYNSFINVRVICRNRASFLVASRNHHYNAEKPKWRKPDSGCIKFNFDGSSKLMKSSIGGVYRNHEGVFLLGYSERIDKATSSVAELVAAKRGLELALENGWFNVWIEGDAKFVMDLMGKHARSGSKEHVKHIKEIKMLLPLLNHFHASHIPRRGNKVADKLANLGYYMKMPKVWREPPAEIINFLLEDANGK
jgi:ribonuclease HI